jgi:diguanylate cyclase (GGDEF)-like protein
MARVEKTVFLSYRRTDFPWALAIYKHLTHNGFDVFFDYLGISSGDFESVILQNIRARAHFLVVLTPSALDRCDDSGDWLRREIEESMECRRNIVPLFVDGFDFAAPTVASHLTGTLGALNRYNGVGVPAEYFEAAMDKLCGKFLNVPLEAVLHPPSGFAQEAAKEQRIAASTDVLTGLMNRREFENRVESALKSTKVRETTYAMCCLDLDQFKIINENCGHSAGDDLLAQVGELLKSKMHARDTLARLGGDEFGVLLENCSLDEAVRAAESLRDAVRSFRFTWKGRAFQLGVSIGVVPISAGSVDMASVMSAADSACQAAKEAGRNRVHGFAEDDIDLMHRRREMQWAGRVNNALVENRFELFRQTILPLQVTEDGARFELLLRMRDETGNIVTPDNFMVAAESYGMMPSTDRWVIEKAFRWLASTVDKHEKLAMCSINVSGQILSDEEFLSYVIDQLQANELDATKICFEMTETAAIANFSQANHFVHSLKNLGCKFALDDFGTGLSSFGYLKHFPVDFLKIDGSFVREVLRDPIDREMVRSINEIAHLTDKQTIAEFAENDAIISMLRSLGVDYAQGFGVSLPLRLLKVAGNA